MGEIGVHERQRVDAGATLGESLANTRPQGGRKSAIACMAHDAQERKSQGRLRKTGLGRVAAAIVHGERDQVETGSIAHSCQTFEQCRDVARLVVHRQNDGNTKHDGVDQSVALRQT